MYSTTNLDEAAYLVAKGFILRRTEPPVTDDDLVTFTFQESDTLPEAVSAWENRYANPVRVDAARFADARQDLYRRVREVLG